jgi:hypothetical protein
MFNLHYNPKTPNRQKKTFAAKCLKSIGLLALAAMLPFFTACNSGSDNNASLSGISLNKDALALEVGATETLTTTFDPGNVTNKNVAWASSNETIAIVNSGMVTAVAAGTATVTATAQEGNKVVSCLVTVVEAAPLNPEYLEWLTQEKEREDTTQLGYIPSPFKRQPIESIESANTAQIDGLEPIVKAGPYPPYYDLRQEGHLTEVRNQGQYGTCWAHASLGSLESYFRKISGQYTDLSEWHLVSNCRSSATYL